MYFNGKLCASYKADVYAPGCKLKTFTNMVKCYLKGLNCDKQNQSGTEFYSFLEKKVYSFRS